MKSTEMLSKIKALLNLKETSLETATLENGTVIEADSFEAGQSVFIVTEDEKVPLPQGEYTLEGGKTLVVEEEGIIATINDSSTEPEDVEAEEEVVVDAPEEVAPAVEEIVQAVVDVIAPLMEEMKKDIEEMKKKYGEEEKDEEKKKEMSAQKPAQKPLTHNPSKTRTPISKNLSLNRPISTMDIVLKKLNK
jgi:hypothetical protein